MDSPSGIAWRGRRVCQCVIDAVNEYEKQSTPWKLLSSWIFQGCYNTSVLASAGTHDLGGVIDSIVFNLTQTKRARTMGLISNHRTVAQGFRAPHNHVYVLGCPHASLGLKFQMSEYYAGRNGLASRARDLEYRPPVIRTFRQYMAWKYATSYVWIGGSKYTDVKTVSVAAVNGRRFKTGVSVPVYWVQVWLRKLGYYKSPLDGKWGNATQAAMNNFRYYKLGLRGSDAQGSVGLYSLTQLAKRAYAKKAVVK